MDFPMATLPGDMSVDLKLAIDELESAVADMESRLESAHAERDEATARQVELEIENAGLRRELGAARERQNASAEILRSIAAASGDAERSLYRIAETSTRLFGATSATIQIAEGDSWVKIIRVGDTSRRVGETVPVAQLRIGGRNMPGTIVAENRQVHVPDLDNVDPAIADWPGLAPSRAAGTRSMSGSPLRREGKAFGVLIVYRDRLAPFTDEEMALQQTFADQAAIAIENARLFNETHESLERQTATADILKVIASSPSDVQPVFDAIAESANRLLGGFSAAVYSLVDDISHLSAFTPITPAADAALQAMYPRPLSAQPWAEKTRKGEIVHVPDIEADPTVSAKLLDVWRMRGFRGFIRVPLVRDRATVGMISVSRAEPGPFAAHHIQLLQTFADQAVIAIENTRLFNETQEALERQTATAEVLKVIASSPSDVQPVFAAIADSAKHLLGAFSTTVLRFIGDELHLVAYTPTDPVADEALQTSFPRKLAEFPTFALVRNGETIQFADTEAEEVPAENRELARLRGFRSVLFTPLMNQGAPVGMISVTRAEPGAFAPHHVQLLQTFADQAVIAIENTRLFNETKEALAQQTATSDVLQVISSSIGDVKPVFEKMLENATRICGAEFGIMGLFDGGVYQRVALYNVPPAFDLIAPKEFRFEPDGPIGSVFRTRQVVKIDDLSQSTGYLARRPPVVAMVEIAGVRTLVVVPMLRDGRPIGAISIYRQEIRQFSDRQIDLLKNFANQAVIAIENTRLFNETQEALERQTATADILKVIASSPSDVQPVFDAIAHSANRLIGGFSAAVFRYLDAKIHLAAFTPTDAEGDAVLQSSFPVPLEKFPPYQLTQNGAPAELPDTDLEPAARDIARARGYRSMLFAPLMNDEEAIGIITVTRVAAGPFGEQHTRLLQMFADQAVIAIENVRLFDEVQARTRDLTEALTYQTGSANILSVIASSPTDVAPALRAIVESACELCEANDALVALREDNELIFQAQHGSIPVVWDRQPIDRAGIAGRAMVERKPVHVHDLLAPEGDEFPQSREFARQTNVRTVLCVPMVREGESSGIIVLRRTEVQPFSEKQIALLQTFADQAVIAIENTRLFNEVRQRTEDLSESLQQQTATADVLKVISRSAFDLEAVMNTLARSASELCGADMSGLFLRENDQLIARGVSDVEERLENMVRQTPVPIDDQTYMGRSVLTGEIVNLADVDSSELNTRLLAFQKAFGYKSLLVVPLLREGRGVGVFALVSNSTAAFSQRQIDLVQTFADQAVIAIENVRLFDEVQAKTRDLSEALTYQTGSANILKVIASSPTDVGPVLTSIVENACELCDAYDAVVFLQDAGELRSTAHHGPIPEGLTRLPITRTRIVGRAFLERKPVHVRDFHSAEGAEFPDGQQIALQMGHRTMLAVPLLREGESIGVITLRRNEVQPFSDKQISLLQTFADQAVIAIGNVRLFEEVQAKTRDLSEALTYQTGSANILKVIASSPTDVGPVFTAIVESACELCEAYDAVLRLKQGDDLCFSAHRGPITTFRENWPISRNWTAGRAVIEKRPIHVHDLLAPEGEDFPEAREMGRNQGHRTVMSVPLMREDESIGAITLRRLEVNPFSDKQIALLQTFADQAVIAIGNVRLFEEVQQRTRELSESLQQQTATADVLQIISSSPGDLAPVFEKMLVNATRVCGAKFGSMLLAENGSMLPAAQYNVPAEFATARGNRVLTPHPKSALAKAISTKQVVHVADMRTTEAYLERFPASIELVELGGARTVAIVPMLRDDEVIGAITVYRNEVQLFSDKQIELLSNFAKQAVIAIENARLLKELRQRTADLSQSLDDLRTAQDRLVQTEKLASLGQLTAGIAHEIKNPLNFVNNFAALSAELTEELNDILKPAEIADKLRTEVDELTGLLKDNLEKIVQHGKRADSIVKNMLLHSREGGGDHRPADINALIDESLNLAYHGARAERPDFNVTLQRDFDPAAGMLDMFPQEISRVFLNLVSNGFYAVTKRRKDNGDAGFEPTLRATTKNLGDTVEIRIRDNGTGIPPEVKEKMFNPFFTTKPAGEGTGLGLSMSHDIIVKQHGGTIDVDTEQGHFTEFRIVLPRTSNFADKSRG
jgi:GAF domain-containing protein